MLVNKSIELRNKVLNKFWSEISLMIPNIEWNIIVDGVMKTIFGKNGVAVGSQFQIIPL